MSRAPILLSIDDNPGDIRLLSEALSDTGSRCVFYAVTSMQSGLVFLERSLCLEGQYPDLIITDLSMPATTGIQAVTTLQDSAWREIPVCVLTGVEQPVALQRCRDIGAVEVLRKPGAWDGYLEVARSIESLAHHVAEHRSAQRRHTPLTASSSAPISSRSGPRKAWSPPATAVNRS